MEYKMGGALRCPECGSSRAKIIWKSADGKTIGIKCPRSGFHHKKNSVILISVQNYRPDLSESQKHHNMHVRLPKLY